MSDGLAPVWRPAKASWQEPFYWWGPLVHAKEPMALADLVESGMLRARQADSLVDHLSGGGSVIVAANPQGAGKSTLAQALIAELPADRVKVYPRGMYEPFDWVDETEPDTTTVLVNEISPHLPVYAWGETLRRLLALAGCGYQVVATAHADTVQELIAQLTAYPIRATAAQIVALDLVVFLEVSGHGDNLERRVGSIVSLTVDDVTGGLIAQKVAD